MIDVRGVRSSWDTAATKLFLLPVRRPQLLDVRVFAVQQLVQPIVLSADVAGRADRDGQQRCVQRQQPHAQRDAERTEQPVDVTLQDRVVLVDLGDRDDRAVRRRSHRDVGEEELVGEPSFVDVLGLVQVGDAAFGLAVHRLADVRELLGEPAPDERGLVRVDDRRVGPPYLDANVAAVAQDAGPHERIDAFEIRAGQRVRQVDAVQREGQNRVRDEARVERSALLGLHSDEADQDGADARAHEQERNEAADREAGDEPRRAGRSAL
jgi:hypothetical protein